MKRFKMHLEDYPLEEGYKSIPRCQTEVAGPTEIADLMVSAYEEAKSVQMIVNIFDRINKKDLSAKIRHEMPARKLRKASSLPTTCSSPKLVFSEVSPNYINGTCS